jgi:hypothetical protein
MKNNIDLENSSYTDIKSILSKLTWKSWSLLFGGIFVVVTALVRIGFIELPWVANFKIRENSSAVDEILLNSSYVAKKVFFKGGYLHGGSSTVESCINDYKKSFNEVGAEIQINKPDNLGYGSSSIAADLNGHIIYGYCYTTATKKTNSHAVLFANGLGTTNGEAQKSANLAGVNLDSVISHLKGVQPL